MDIKGCIASHPPLTHLTPLIPHSLSPSPLIPHSLSSSPLTPLLIPLTPHSLSSSPLIPHSLSSSPLTPLIPHSLSPSPLTPYPPHPSSLTPYPPHPPHPPHPSLIILLTPHPPHPSLLIPLTPHPPHPSLIILLTPHPPHPSLLIPLTPHPPLTHLTPLTPYPPHPDGLPGASVRNADKVPPTHSHGPALSLDGRGFREAHFHQRLVDVGGEVGLLDGRGRLRNVSSLDVHPLRIAIGLHFFLEGNGSGVLESARQGLYIINLVPRPPAQTLSRSRGEKTRPDSISQLWRNVFLHGCEIKSGREVWVVYFLHGCDIRYGREAWVRG